MVANGHLWTRAQFTKPALDLVWHRDYSLKSGGFSLNTLAGRVRVCFAMSGMDRHPLPRVSRCMQAILREAAWVGNTCKVHQEARRHGTQWPNSNAL